MDTLGPSPVFDSPMQPLPPEPEPTAPRRSPKLLIVSLIVACGVLLTGTVAMTIMLMAAQRQASLHENSNRSAEYQLKQVQKRLSEADDRIRQAQDEASSARREALDLRMEKLNTIRCQSAAVVVKEAMAGKDKFLLDAALKQLAENCAR